MTAAVGVAGVAEPLDPFGHCRLPLLVLTGVLIVVAADAEETEKTAGSLGKTLTAAITN